MKLQPARLEQQLRESLAPVYVVSGDEPLLTGEACDHIRQTARQQGFEERQVFTADNGFDWSQLLEAGASLSLFASQRLIELRLNSLRPGERGIQALLDYQARPPAGNLLLVSLPRLDGPARRAKWIKTLQDSPQVQFIQIWPVEPAQLPRWIGQRLARAGLQATPDAIELLAGRVEGNLLAAVQEIEKLKLLAPEQPVSLNTIQASVAESARYDVFGLVSCLLAGQASHGLQMLYGLRAEGSEPPVVLWALARELRQLATLSLQQARGNSATQLIAQIRPPLPEKHQQLLARALPRHDSAGWNRLLLQAQQVDACIKGQSPGDAWTGLAGLCLGLAGQSLPF